jgi:hypothetical protein
MIYAVTAENEKGEQMEMRLSCPQFSGQNIYNIEGLGTPRADINLSEMAALDGSLFNSSYARSRTVILHIKYVDSDFVGSPGCMYPPDSLGVCTDSYLDLEDKPSINDVTLVGNMTAEQLGLQNEMDPIENPTIEKLLKKYWLNAKKES